MRKFLIAAVLMMASAWAQSQSILSFCTYVNAPAQECVFDNVKFITSPDSTHARIFMMLRGNEVFATAKLTYKAFALDRFGKEVFLFDIDQVVEATWMNAWQPAVFTSPGKYLIKVYRDPEHVIAARGFELYNN